MRINHDNAPDFDDDPGDCTDAPPPICEWPGCRDEATFFIHALTMAGEPQLSPMAFCATHGRESSRRRLERFRQAHGGDAA